MRKLYLIICLLVSIGNDLMGQEYFIEMLSINDINHEEYISQTEKYDTYDLVKDISILRIGNPYEFQVEGKFLLTSNNEEFPSQILRSIYADYENNGEYKWRGRTYDKNFELTLLRSTNGTSGTIIYRQLNKTYRILPLNSSTSLLLDIKTQEFTCGTDGGSDGFLLTDDCDEECAGHIDILFYISVEASTYLGSNVDSELGLMISDLQAAFLNSDIPHTVSYNYTYVDRNFTNSCDNDVKDFNADSALENLRAAYGCDLAIMLAPPSQYSGTGSTLACVEDIGPNSSMPVANMPVDLGLDNFTFVHEVGHLLGGKHRWYPHAPDPQCAFAHRMYDNSNFIYTVMEGNSGLARILHYSDPDIEYAGLPTGIDNEADNAGYIRGNGCSVSGFNASLEVNPIIIFNKINCDLELEALIDWQNPDFTFDWYWNHSGMFSGANPDFYLGSGMNLTVPEPSGNPCENYFIHLKVKLNGNEVASITISDTIDCTVNVHCEDPPVYLRPEKDENEILSLEAFEQHILLKQSDRSDDKSFFIYNAMGQLMTDNYFYKNQMIEGVYLIVEIRDGNILNVNRFYINNKN